MSQDPIHLPIAADGRAAWRHCCLMTAAISAVFIVIIAGIMLGSVFREHDQGLLTTDQITGLKKQLIADGTNDALKEKIRDADQKLREVYFVRRAFWTEGAWLLLGGGIVLGISIKYAVDLGYRPFMPTGAVPSGPRLDRPMKIGMALAGLLLATFFIGAGLPGVRGLRFASLTGQKRATATGNPPLVNPGAIVSNAPASDDEMAANWPSFRGPGNLGIATGTYPTTWDAASGRNIAWSTPIPLLGNNSPIVWENRVFVSGSTAAQHQVYCLDATTGALQWTASVGADATGKLKLSDETGWAPSTMATDGRRIIALFPNGDLAAIGFDGKPQWSRSLGIPNNMYGHASSLLVASGTLIVQWDQGNEPKDHAALVYAIDSVTGKDVWKEQRAVASSWSTPSLITVGGTRQVITLSNPWVIAYDLKAGTELWKAKGLDGEVTPSAAFADGILFAVQDRADLLAIRPDGKGDVTQSHMKKLDAEPLPDIVSPVAVGDRLLLVGTSGLIACIQPSTGESLWEAEIDAGFHASPIAAGNTIYLTDTKGVTHVFELGAAFKEIAKNPLGQEVNATPALLNGRIFIRGKNSLFCIRQKSASAAPSTQP